MQLIISSALHRHREKLARIAYFFPLRLIVLHIKKNHFLIFFWLVLFGIITGLFADRIGVPQQFLVPEYRGATGIIAFGVVGFAVGGFITAFNLYTYIMHGFRFPFIATLSRPFHKFALNNFIIPGLFVVVYLWCSANFQYYHELIEPPRIVFNLLSFLLGITLFQALSYFYFRYTNKDARSFGNEPYDSPVDTPLQAPRSWTIAKDRTTWHVETYLYSFRRIALARESAHYERDVLEKVFSQNHINAARFEIALILSFVIIGSLRENEHFVIPAAASTVLFFTMLLMLISALHSWIRGWTLTVFLVALGILNFFYADLRLFRIESRGYGLNYDTVKAHYHLRTIIPDSLQRGRDIEHGLDMLHNWHRKVLSRYPARGQLPKLVIIDCSGGGSRSATWTMRALIAADSVCDQRLLDHATLITGASGGMVGAAYLREVYLRKELGEEIDIYNPEYPERMSRDLLNPVILTTAVNDWFIRYQVLRDGEYTYKKDRAWAFEKQLARNTEGLFDKRLRDYSQAEFEGQIPMMILSPTIIDDGRRLLIAAQPMSYLIGQDAAENDPYALQEEVEFTRLFSDQDAMNLRFISALRMNATFPYVFPITTLPSQPEIGVMDAGIRDNFGLKTTYRYLDAWSRWIETNTSGVIIVQVRDLPKGVDLRDKTESLFGRFMAPMGSIYGNMTRTQDYTNQQMLRYFQSSCEVPVDLVNLQLNQDMDSHISLSWHLTRSEKITIREALRDSFFLAETERLKKLLIPEPERKSD
ncbi:MAG: patatin-like phospholipase family protein [Flavobacteriales bacterium]